MAPLPLFNRWTFFALVAVAVASRLLPHPPNFAFLGALCLFAGCHLRGSKTLLVPLSALLISDTIGHFAGLRGMGFYNPVVMFFVYLGVAWSGLIGTTLRSRQSTLRIVSASVACSMLFFLLSNFGVWVVGASPATFASLFTCYTAALPFF